MTAILFLLFFVLLAVAAVLWGVDSRDTGYSVGDTFRPHLGGGTGGSTR